MTWRENPKGAAGNGERRTGSGWTHEGPIAESDETSERDSNLAEARNAVLQTAKPSPGGSHLWSSEQTAPTQLSFLLTTAKPPIERSGVSCFCLRRESHREFRQRPGARIRHTPFIPMTPRCRAWKHASPLPLHGFREEMRPLRRRCRRSRRSRCRSIRGCFRESLWSDRATTRSVA